MLLFVVSALAFNSTGTVRYPVGVSANLPLPTGSLGVFDGVRTAESRDVVAQMELVTQGLGYQVRSDLTCATGAVGQLQLVELDVTESVETRGVQVNEKTFSLGASSNSRDVAVSTSRNGQVLGHSGSQSRSNLNIGYAEKVPAVEATATVTLRSRWTLTDCAGHEIYSDLDEVTLSRVVVAPTDEEARSHVDPKSIRSTHGPKELAKLQRGRFKVRGVEIERRFYDAGTSQLEAAARFVKGRHQDWKAAREAWLDTTFATNSRIRARGFYNMALYHERAGNIDAALEAVEQAWDLNANSLTLKLRDELRARQRRLQQQG